MSSRTSDLITLQEVYHYLELGRFQAAKTSLSPLLAQNPTDGHLHYLMAFSLWGLDQGEEALVSCQEALANGYVSDLCYCLLGRIQMELEQCVEAEESFLAALSENPQNAEAMAAYGFLMLKTGHGKKARRLLAEALRLDPDDETVLHFNFFYFLAKDLRGEQLEMISRYLLRVGPDVRHFINAGLADLFRKDWRSARENFRQAYLLEPTNPNLLALLEYVVKRTHPFFWPLNFVDRLGGPAVVWLLAVVVVMVLGSLKQYVLMGIFVIGYLLYAIYSWLVNPLYNLLQRIRR